MRMNKLARRHLARISAVALGCMSFAGSAQAAGTYYTGGARFHATHSRFEEYPFSSGDISWQAGVEFHEGVGYWQLIVGYAPSIKEREEKAVLDSVITPQINLLLQDKGWLVGTGAYMYYIKDEIESDWSKVFWQAMIGYEFKLKSFDVSILGIYSFDDWGNISDFKFENIEPSAMIKKQF
jgi:hypothetical protein